MRLDGQEGSLREHFLRQSGSQAQGNRNQNIFCELALQKWELGMHVLVAEKVGQMPSFDPSVIVSKKASCGLPSPPCYCPP